MVIKSRQIGLRKWSEEVERELRKIIVRKLRVPKESKWTEEWRENIERESGEIRNEWMVFSCKNSLNVGK